MLFPHPQKAREEMRFPSVETPVSRMLDPLWLVSRALTKLYSLWVKAAYPFHALGKRVSFHYTCDLWNTKLMDIGDFVTIHKDVWLHAHLAPENRGEPVLKIGKQCFIARRAHISAKNQIDIENDVLLAASVLIQDHGHEFSDVTLPIKSQGSTPGGRIRIGQGSWIGQGVAIICDSGELNLGRNCVVAANSVVTRGAPAYSVLSGNPARIVKQFDPAKSAWVLGSVRPAEAEAAKPLASPAAADGAQPSEPLSAESAPRPLLRK